MRTASAMPSTHGARSAKKRSSFVAKWLKTVCAATSAAATSAMVTDSKPRTANRSCAVCRISARVSAFFHARRSGGSLPVRA